MISEIVWTISGGIFDVADKESSLEDINNRCVSFVKPYICPLVPSVYNFVNVPSLFTDLSSASVSAFKVTLPEVDSSEILPDCE